MNKHGNESTGSVQDSKLNLYVKNLGPNMTVAKFYEMFSPYGLITKYKVNPTGSAYISYARPDQAASAIHALHGRKYKDKELYVDYFQSRDERSLVLAGIHLAKGTNLIVKNLEKTIMDDALRGLFSQFGHIISAKVKVSQMVSLGYGFVCFSTPESASMALEKMNNATVLGKRLSVEVYEKNNLTSGEAEKNNLYVKNLNSRVNDERLKSLFEPFGMVVSAKVALDGKGNSKLFGFVCMKSSEEAHNALKEMNGKEVDGKSLFVDYHQTKEDRQAFLQRRLVHRIQKIAEGVETTENKNLYVKNLDARVEDKTLEYLFDSFGSVISAKVARDEKGQSKLFGYVCMGSEYEAKSAINAMDGYLLLGKPLFVAFHQLKSERASISEEKESNTTKHQEHAPHLAEEPIAWTEGPGVQMLPKQETGLELIDSSDYIPLEQGQETKKLQQAPQEFYHQLLSDEAIKQKQLLPSEFLLQQKTSDQIQEKQEFKCTQLKNATSDLHNYKLSESTRQPQQHGSQRKTHENFLSETKNSKDCMQEADNEGLKAQVNHISQENVPLAKGEKQKVYTQHGPELELSEEKKSQAVKGKKKVSDRLKSQTQCLKQTTQSNKTYTAPPLKDRTASTLSSLSIPNDETYGARPKMVMEQRKRSRSRRRRSAVAKKTLFDQAEPKHQELLADGVHISSCGRINEMLDEDVVSMMKSLVKMSDEDILKRF